MASQFSLDGKYFAEISLEGKLKIWNTVSNSFEQEFTPDYHLTSPCTCLHFTQTSTPTDKLGTPRKKKRKESLTVGAPNIILGTKSGLLLSYSIPKGDINFTINSKTSQSINCLSINQDGSFVYSGLSSNIYVWNMLKRNVARKWSAGNEKIGAILITPDENRLLTTSKSIKLWDVARAEVLKTFTGHASEICVLQYISPKKDSADSYIVTGSQGDRILNCWNLNENLPSKNSVAGCLMEDIVKNLSVYTNSDGSTNLAATVRSGAVHIYKHTLNGTSSKPLKPRTTIQIASDAQNNQTVTPIMISAAVFRDEQTLCIGYGNGLVLTFENLTITDDKKLQCLLRSDPQKQTEKHKAEAANKLRIPVVSDDVHYLTAQSGVVSKRKHEGQREVPMEERLENLTLNKLDSTRVPKSDNVAQLLVQGLHSKDKKILRSVLCKRDEQIIRNTIKRLPMAVIIPLVEELTQFVQGKSLSTQIGAVWMRHLLMVHAGLLLSNPDLHALFSKTLNSFESRLALQQPLNRLKGRLDLIISQISDSGSMQETPANEQAMLVFNDRASSDSDDGMEVELHSESENEWYEDSTDNEENGAKNKEGDEDSNGKLSGNESADEDMSA